MLIFTVTFAQDKNAKASLEVDGVCLMCKARIEKACLATKGVKSANWDVKTHELKLFFDELINHWCWWLINFFLLKKCLGVLLS